MKDKLMPWLAGILLAAVFAPTGMWLWDRWTMSIWQNGHGMFVPLVVGYLAYQHLKHDRSGAEETSPWGFLFFVPGLLMVVADSGIRTQLLSAVGLIFTTIGLAILLLGARSATSLVFPLVLLFLMLPIPTAFIDRFVLLLRVVSATGCEHLTRFTGLAIFRDFTTLHLPRNTLEIADACSGFSTLYATVTMALILAYLTPSIARRIFILLAAAPIAIGCNIVRCVALAYLVHYRGSEVLGTPLHPMTGIFSFSAALVILFSLSWFGLPKERYRDTTVEAIPAPHLDRAGADPDPGRRPFVREAD